MSQKVKNRVVDISTTSMNGLSKSRLSTYILCLSDAISERELRESCKRELKELNIDEKGLRES